VEIINDEASLSPEPKRAGPALPVNSASSPGNASGGGDSSPKSPGGGSASFDKKEVVEGGTGANTATMFSPELLKGLRGNLRKAEPKDTEKEKESTPTAKGGELAARFQRLNKGATTTF